MSTSPGPQRRQRPGGLPRDLQLLAEREAAQAPPLSSSQITDLWALWRPEASLRKTA